MCREEAFCCLCFLPFPFITIKVLPLSFCSQIYLSFLPLLSPTYVSLSPSLSRTSSSLALLSYPFSVHPFYVNLPLSYPSPSHTMPPLLVPLLLNQSLSLSTPRQSLLSLSSHNPPSFCFHPLHQTIFVYCSSLYL